MKNTKSNFFKDSVDDPHNHDEKKIKKVSVKRRASSDVLGAFYVEGGLNEEQLITGRKLGSIFATANSTGSITMCFDDRVRGFGGGDGLSYQKIDAVNTVAAIQKHLGQRVTNILEKVCFYDYAPNVNKVLTAP